MPKQIKDFMQGIDGTQYFEYDDNSTASARLDTLQEQIQPLVSGAWITFEQNGAVGDGVADDTAVVFSTLVAAAGRTIVPAPGKIYRITQPLTDSAATKINIAGLAPVLFSHTDVTTMVNTNSSDYNAFNLAPLASVAVFLCDGCNLIGAPDTATMNADSGKLRSLLNVFVLGKNGAEVGVYTSSADTTIDGVTFALFGRQGILTRGQITSRYGDIMTIDCGHALAATGAIGYPNTYYSGCSVLHLANKIAGDYSTINADRPSSLSHGMTFTWVRNQTCTTKSGLRGVQAHGLLSGTFENLQGYTGNLFVVCAATVAGYHVENYSTAGPAIGDNLPVCVYQYNSTLLLGAGYASNMGGTNLGNEVFSAGSNTLGIPQDCAQFQRGSLAQTGPVRSRLKKRITVSTPGGTDVYTFSRVIPEDIGFVGIVPVSMVRPANYASWTRAAFFTGNHKAGGSGWQPMTSVSLGTATTLGGGFSGALALSWSGADLRASVTWGASWAVGDSFEIEVGLIGCGSLSI